MEVLRARWEAVGVTLAGVVAVVTLVASGAFACTNLATISLSAEAARPGDTVILTGTSFPVPRSTSPATPTPVEIHWKSADGPILATATPDRTGTIGLSISIPETDPGPVVIVATQRKVIPNATNPEAPPVVSDEYGTPARATIRILAPGERLGRDTVAASNFVIATSDGSSTALVIMLVLFGAVALSLFAGGVIAFLHQMRARQMIAQPWRYR